VFGSKVVENPSFLVHIFQEGDVNTGIYVQRIYEGKSRKRAGLERESL
jgi:hypothetical protein